MRAVLTAAAFVAACGPAHADQKSPLPSDPKAIAAHRAKTVAHLLEHGWAVAKELPNKAAPHLQGASCHDVVERRHALEEGDVLEGAGDALACGEIGSHVVAPLALERERRPAGDRSR